MVLLYRATRFGSEFDFDLFKKLCGRPMPMFQSIKNKIQFFISRLLTTTKDCFNKLQIENNTAERRKVQPENGQA